MKLVSFRPIKKMPHIAVAAFVLAFVFHASADDFGSFTMDFVEVNGAGNVSDPLTGKGAVGYNYRIGQNEVTVDQFHLSGVGSGNENYWESIGTNAAPASMVSWNEAAQFANYLTSGDKNSGAYGIDGGGNVTGIDRGSAISSYSIVYVIPNEDEWYKAAYFNVGDSQYYKYANGADTAPVAGLLGANYDNASSSNAWLVGSGAMEVNGTYDMMGNVYEWTETAATNAGERITLGGRYNSTIAGLDSDHFRNESELTEYQGIGFRVAAIPEPGTISLMSLSTLGLFITRRIRRRHQLGKSFMPLRRVRACDVFKYEEGNVEEYISSNESATMRFIVSRVQNVTSSVKSGFENLDKQFWSHMVEAHERRVLRRISFRTSAKIKALNFLDSFLEKVIK